MTDSRHILIVDDDREIRTLLGDYLQKNGYRATAVADGKAMRRALEQSHVDLIVLDLMLPDGSGMNILKDLRSSQNDTPVLLLTARDTVRDRVAGLDTGADDYLGKPFDLDEVAARLRALSRRSTGRSTAALEWASLRLDPARQLVEQAGKPVQLSRREYSILHTLMTHPGVIFSKTKLEDRLYGWQEEIESNAIEVHIHHLRSKLGPGLIETGMTEFIYERAKAKGQESEIGRLNPLKRGGAPIEIANAALFLASDEASYVNGQAIIVDGGLSASHPFNHQSYGRTTT